MAMAHGLGRVVDGAVPAFSQPRGRSCLSGLGPPVRRPPPGGRQAKLAGVALLATLALLPPAAAQLNDVTQTPNAENEGIKKPLTGQVGPGRGGDLVPGSSAYLILRDPFRSINRGRQLFQRKFTAAQGLGPRTGDG